MSSNNTSATKPVNTQKLVLLALLTAIVVVLQFLGAFIRFGPFSITLVLMPIVVGSALTGVYAGGWLGLVFGFAVWLGLVFGFAVLMSGDAAAFMAINAFGAIVIVLAKGALAGLAAGSAYRLLARKSRTVAAIVSAAVCPIVNTGIFIIGCYVFFLDTINEWGAGAGFENAAAYIFLGMIGLNFIFEFALNIVLSPVIVRLIQFGQDRRTS